MRCVLRRCFTTDVSCQPADHIAHLEAYHEQQFHHRRRLQDSRSPSSALKTGVSAPTYRPSVLPMRVGTGGGGSRARGKLAPSAPAAVAAALHHLVTDRRTLEV